MFKRKDPISIPHFSSAWCEYCHSAALQEVTLGFHTSEHHLEISLDANLVERPSDVFHLYNRMSRATEVLPAGAYRTRNPNDFAL